MKHYTRRNSPIRESGDGNQSCYLAPISDALGIAILELLGKAPAETSNEEEEDVTAVLESSDLTETEKQQLVQARRGQGRFRAAVLALEPKCRITGVAVAKLLRASHIKPWRDSDNRERLDGANGLMLAPHIDLLFDKGLISFSDSGKLLISNGLPRTVLAQWAIDPQITVGAFSTQQASYLQFHRKRYGY